MQVVHYDGIEVILKAYVVFLQGAKVERVVRLLWKMAMHPHAPPEVQQELPSVLTSYAETEAGKATLSDYIAKCSNQLRNGANVVAVVSMLTGLVEAVGASAVKPVGSVSYYQMHLPFTNEGFSPFLSGVWRLGFVASLFRNKGGVLTCSFFQVR